MQGQWLTHSAGSHDVNTEPCNEVRDPAMQEDQTTKDGNTGVIAAVDFRLKTAGLSLAEVFQAWQFHALEMIPRSPLGLKPAEAGYWRQKEAYLTAARTYPMVAEMFRRRLHYERLLQPGIC